MKAIRIIFFQAILLSLISFTLGCKKKSEREKKVDLLEEKSLEIINDIRDEIEYANNNKKVVWRPDMERVEREWRKIHLDSAEIGLRYVMDFDSLFELNTQRKKIQVQSEKRENLRELVDILKENYDKWLGK